MQNIIKVTAINETNQKWFDNFIPQLYRKQELPGDTMYLGIILEKIAIGIVVIERIYDRLHIHWIYVAPEYRRFHYASQALNQIKEKLDAFQCSVISADCDTIDSRTEEIEKFFAVNDFIKEIEPHEIYCISIKELEQYPPFKKIAGKKISGNVIPFSQVQDYALKNWNQKYFIINNLPLYNEYSFLYMDKGEIAGVLLGSRKSESEFILELLYSIAPSGISLLDLILKFIEKIRETGGMNGTLEVIVTDIKMEQLVKKIFGVQKADRHIELCQYVYSQLETR